MSRKQLPPPASGGDLTALLRARHARTDDDAPEPQAALPAAAPQPARPSARAKGPAMDRRSWYMPKESADALAAALEDLHWSTRKPKHAIMAVLVAVALEHLDDVRQRIEADQ